MTNEPVHGPRFAGFDAPWLFRMPARSSASIARTESTINNRPASATTVCTSVLHPVIRYTWPPIGCQHQQTSTRKDARRPDAHRPQQAIRADPAHRVLHARTRQQAVVRRERDEEQRVEGHRAPASDRMRPPQRNQPVREDGKRRDECRAARPCEDPVQISSDDQSASCKE